MAKGTIQAQVRRTMFGFIATILVVAGLAYWFLSGGTTTANEVSSGMTTLKQRSAERGQY